MIKKYQVVCLEKDGYILEYKNFTIKENQEMLLYINAMSHAEKCVEIEVTRWNEKNERE